MPIYEYVCASCGHRFETRQKFSDDPLEDCPSCGASVRRVLHPTGVIFKGSGWYSTDSRKSDNTAAASNGKDDSGSSDAKSDKPEPKSAETKKEPAAPAASG